MKLNFLHKAGSLLMAILVMLSTVSVTVEKHYCKDHLVDVAIFGKAKKCGSVSNGSTKNTIAKTCCQDTLEVFQGQDKLHKADFNIKIEKPVLLYTTMVFEYTIQNSTAIVHIPLPQHYIPPNPKVNIQVLHQTFLI